VICAVRKIADEMEDLLIAAEEVAEEADPDDFFELNEEYESLEVARAAQIRQISPWWLRVISEDLKCTESEKRRATESYYAFYSQWWADDKYKCCVHCESAKFNEKLMM